MFKNTFQSGFLSIFYSLGSDPLQLWAKRVGPPPSSSKSQSTSNDNEASTTPTQPVEPHIDFLIDDTLNSRVLEIMSTHLPTTFITTPSLPTRTLGIKLPFLVFLVKNLGKYWSFEVAILDDRGEQRRFRASNFQDVEIIMGKYFKEITSIPPHLLESRSTRKKKAATTRVKSYITTMPLRMDPGWNQIQLNLADLTKRAYGTAYAETQRITIHANCRIRRIYFSDRLVPENDLPAEFKLYLPVVK